MNVIGNNPQISQIAQIQNPQEKIGENLRHLRMNLALYVITDKV